MDKFTSICSNFMSGACVLINMVGHLMATKRWGSTNITSEVLPDEMPIIYKHVCEDTPRDDALPIVTYSLGPTSMENAMAAVDMSGRGSTTTKTATTIKFQISTTNSGLSTAIALEIATLCMAAAKALRSYHFFVTSATIGEAQPVGTSYYKVDVAIQGSLGLPVWNLNQIEDKLREFGLVINNGYSNI